MKDILEKVGRNDGFRVPEGYFDSFAESLEQQLPPNDMELAARAGVVAPRSIWQRVRPYVYLAAMFMGVWCMMNMVSLLHPSDPDTASPALAAALGNEQFVGDYMASEGVYDDYGFIETLYDEGFSPESFDLSDVPTD